MPRLPGLELGNQDRTGNEESGLEVIDPAPPYVASELPRYLSTGGWLGREVCIFLAVKSATGVTTITQYLLSPLT